MAKEVRFFLGGHSPEGFVSLFDQLDKSREGWRKIIIKGGPGSGKSTLMKRCAAAMNEAGHRLETIPCASDPDSLDAVIDWDAKIAMADGTAPHVIEAAYPGAFETVVNTADAWEEDKLQESRNAIVELADAVSHLHGCASACVCGAGALLAQNRKTAAGVLDMDKIRQTGRELAKGWPEGERAEETNRLLAAVSAGDVVFFAETLTALADVIYEIDDPWGAGAHALLEDLRTQALDKKLKVIACPSFLAEKKVWAHLFLPELGVAFTTANRFHRGQWKPWVVRSLIAEDWMDRKALAHERPAMEACSDSAAAMVERAASFVAQARTLHDELEAKYAAAMDYDMLNAMTERLIESITQ